MMVEVGYIPRVEGEGFIKVDYEDGKLKSLKLGIFEPPRLFEAILVGRPYFDAPEITARICGICYMSYYIAAAQAIEKAFGVSIPAQVKALRRLARCGGWIQSHALHMFLLHLPDFLGYDDAFQMAKDHPDIVKEGLFVKKVGNEILKALGKRAVNPVNFTVGGLFRKPKKKELENLLKDIEKASDITYKLVKWMAKNLDFPDFEVDYEFVALDEGDRYPMVEGRFRTSSGLEFVPEEFEEYVEEEHVEYSNSLRAYLRDKGPYLTGPLARINLNFDKLHPSAKQLAKESGLKPPCKNQYMSILCRGVEVFHALQEAREIIKGYDEDFEVKVEVNPRKSRGASATEAPRGILYHRYDFDENGTIVSARVIAPTTQNLKRIEEDLKLRANEFAKLPEDKAGLEFEKIVRNYDPCISCATHFIKVKITRG